MSHNKKVRKFLVELDLSISNLAKITGFSRVYVSYLMSGKIKSIRAQKIIAFVLGRKPEDIWDDWNQPDASGEN